MIQGWAAGKGRISQNYIFVLGSIIQPYTRMPLPCASIIEMLGRYVILAWTILSFRIEICRYNIEDAILYKVKIDFLSFLSQGKFKYKQRFIF